MNAYEYDAIGQLTQVTQTGQEGGNAVADKRVDLTYFTPGRVNGITRYGSLTTDNFVLSAGYTYGEYPGGFFDDPTGNLTAMTYTALAPNYLGSWQPTTVVQYNWTYDAGGRVHTFYSEGDATFYSNGTDTATYTYDQTSQLVGVTHTNTALSGEDFSYDPNGNRTNDDNTPGTNNELQSDGTYNYTYDNEGNRIERDRITPITGALDNTTLYAWDYRDRLTSVTMMTDSSTVVRTVNYTYDTSNLRISETVVDAEAGTSVTDFVYDGTNVALDFTADNTEDLPTLARRYLYGQAVDQLLAQEDYDPTTDRVVDDLWQLTDNQGTVRDVIKTEDGSTVLSEQQQITFATVPVGGTWTITTVAGTTDPLAYNASLADIQAALDATTTNPGDILISGSYAHGFMLTYAGSSYAQTDVSQATVDTSALMIAATEVPTVVESVAGEAAVNEQWTFDVDHPTGSYVLFGPAGSSSAYADGHINGEALLAQLVLLYGEGNVSISTTATITSGSFTITFIGELAGMPLTDPPSIELSGSFSGSATLSNLIPGFAGLHEVQSITPPAGANGGSWSVAGVTFDWNAGAISETVGDVTVTGNGGGATLTWTSVGPQSLVSGDFSGLTFPMGYVHDLGSWTPGFTHDLGDWEAGYTHDLGSWEPGFTHDLGDWTPGFTHDLGDWEPGYTHDLGSWEQGFTHDLGTWVTGWNVYGLDEDNQRVWLFFSQDYPDSEYTDFESGREWQPDPEGGTTFTLWSSSTPDDDWYNAVASSQWYPDIGGGTTFTATDAPTPDDAWYNAVAGTGWVPATEGGTTFSATTDTTPDPLWYDALPSREWDPAPDGGTTFTLWSSSTPDDDWYNAVASSQWYPDIGGGTTFTVTDASTPDDAWYNAVAGTGWVPAAGGGTTFTATTDTTPDPLWYNAVAAREWDPDPDGGTTWTEADEPDPDWVNVVGPQREFPDDAGAATETTVGVSANDEVTGFTFDHPTGLYTFDGGGSSLTIYLGGSIDATTLATVLATLYGSDNTIFSLTSGDESHGIYTIEFVNGLSDTPLAGPPFVQPASAFSGSASFTNLVEGCVGVHEVQVITLPAGVAGGTWQINGGSALDWDVDHAALETYLDSLLGKNVTVAGDPGGPYTVTWTEVGAQDLLEVENIDLQIHDSATVTTLQAGGTTFHAHMAYSVFGNLLSAVGADGNPIADIGGITHILYAGYWLDTATNNYRAWFRDLDPITGNWITIDPTGLKPDTNPYRDVGNNPTNATDPSGLEAPSGRFVRGFDEGFGLGPLFYKIEDLKANQDYLQIFEFRVDVMTQRRRWYERRWNETY